MQFHPSHFDVCILFALFASVVLGIVSKRTGRQRLEYTAYCFVCFIASVFIIGWLMY